MLNISQTAHDILMNQGYTAHVTTQCGSNYLSGMLQGCLVKQTPVIICKLLMRGAHIKIGAVSPLLGQHRPILRTLRQLSDHLLQMSDSHICLIMGF